MAMLQGDALAAVAIRTSLPIRSGGPFDRLKAADGAADQGVDAVDAQNVGQQPVRPYHVADRQFGEIFVIGASGRRIDVQRPGRAVVRAEYVGADDEMLGGVEEFARFDRVRPP